MDVPEIPRFAELSTEADINYLCNIRDDKDYNIKYLPKYFLLFNGESNCYEKL